MSWSRSYSGTAAEVTQAARDSQQEIKARIPSFERHFVGAAIEAAETALEAVPEGATVSLSLSGHGYENPAPAPGDTASSCSLSVSLSYAVTAI